MQLGEAFSSSYATYKSLNVKGELINIKRAWTKNSLSPRQELNPWPPKHRAGVLFTELREFMESNNKRGGSRRRTSKHALQHKRARCSVATSAMSRLFTRLLSARSLCSVALARVTQRWVGSQVRSARLFNLVHRWQASCILLWLALSQALSCRSIYVSRFITELKTHHLYSLITKSISMCNMHLLGLERPYNSFSLLTE